MKKFVILLIFVLTCCLCIFALAEDDIVGNWTATEIILNGASVSIADAGSSMTMMINSDYTCSTNVNGSTSTGIWSKSGNTYYVEGIEVNIIDGKLYVPIEDMTIVFSRETSNMTSTQSNMVFIPEKGVSIAVPSDYIVVKREDAKLDSRLSDMGFNYSDLNKLMKQNNVYLYAFHPDFSKEINVVINDSNGLNSLNMFSDELLLSFIDEFATQYDEVGGKITKKDIKRDNDDVKIRMWLDYLDYPDQKAYQYTFVEDGQTIVATLISYEGDISPEDESLLDTVVATSVFTKHNQDISGDNRYTDASTGMKFIIPAGWEERNMSQNREFLKMKMSPVGDSVSSIMFGYQDVWNSIPESSRKEWGIKNKSDLDNLFMDKEYIADIYGTDEKDIAMEYHAGHLFAIGKTKQDSGFGFTLEMTVATTFVDGYMIQFQMADLSNTYNSVFLNVLDSFAFGK